MLLACEHVHAVHAYTTGIHILRRSIPHTLIPYTLPGRYGVCKRVCTRVWCNAYPPSTHEAIHSFVLVFYECTFHHTLGPGYGEHTHTPSRRVQGTCPHTRVHTRVWVWNIQVHIMYMNEVMKKKYIAYIRAILYKLYTILVYI